MSTPPRRALLIVDMQVGLFHGPERPYQAAQLLANTRLLIERARDAQAPIFAVRHTGPQGSPIAAGSPFWQLLPELALDASHDTLFDKTHSSSFYGTALATHLRARHVQELVIAGLKTQYCVDSACRAAAEQGFTPLLAADAHSCMNTPQLPAASIIAHHNHTLGGAIAQLQASADIRF